jgi:hypothetical protein
MGDATDDERARGRGPWVGCLAIGMLLGLPGYVLSFGPALSLVVHGYLPKEVLMIYRPLYYLGPQFRNWADWYGNLWQ